MATAAGKTVAGRWGTVVARGWQQGPGGGDGAHRRLVISGGRIEGHGREVGGAVKRLAASRRWWGRGRAEDGKLPYI